MLMGLLTKNEKYGAGQSNEHLVDILSARNIKIQKQI